MTDAALFVGGRVYTGRRYVEALLVDAGRVVVAGSAEAARRDAPTGAERVDLAGRLLVPGLADAHLHVGEIARAREAVDARSAGSVEALQARLRQAAERLPAGPIVGRGLDIDSISEHRWPTVAELDRAVPDRPVVVVHASGHAAVANSLALERVVGPGGAGRAAREGSSVVVEEELGRLGPLIDEALPLSELNVGRTLHELAQVGLTTVGTMNTGATERAVLERLDAGGRLPMRVRAYLPLDRRSALAHPAPSGVQRFAVIGVKGFLDGAFGPRTAALAAPYADDPANRGVDRFEDPELRRALDDPVLAGRSVALHAIGDRAVERAARALASRPATPLPPRIEHASLTPPPVLAALRGAAVHAVVQPGFLLSDLWLADRLGRDRARWAYVFRSLIDLGLPVAGSSDAPYDPPTPWRGIRAAVERHDELGRSANPRSDQALSVPEALELYLGSAHAALGIPDGGRLEAGCRADLVVLDAPSVERAIGLAGTPVRSTWVEGRPVPAGPDDRSG